jgi:hypothetical protein
MKSRLPFRLLLAAVAVTAAAVSFFVTRRDAPEPLFSASVDRTIPDTACVWFGTIGDWEVMLRPYYAEADRDEFNRRRMNEGFRREDRPLAYRLLWLVRHGETTAVHPSAHGARILVGKEKIEAVPIDRLIDEAGAKLKPFFKRIVEAESVGAAMSVAPGSIARLIVAMPPDLLLEEIDSVTFVYENVETRLVRGRSTLVDLWEFEESPRGRLAEIFKEGFDRPNPSAVADRPKPEKN